jgi:hypothetical protein
MSQHDMDIANGSGATFRADLNAALLAMASCSSGATAPSITFAYQYWADTANDLLKQRNAANTAWVSILTLSTGKAVIAATADVATNGTPVGTIIDFSGTSAPSGYLACPVAQTDISRTTYAALFAAIGTTWGAGNGSTTFGMPWFPEGFASVQANANVGASVNGSIPSHNHAIVTVGAPGSGATTGMVLTGTGSAQGTITTYITAAGSGTGNKAAGVKILKCVKY